MRPFCAQQLKTTQTIRDHSLNGSLDSVNGDLQFLWG